MPPVSFVCPKCRAPLRLQNPEQLIAESLPCPECHVELNLRRNSDGNFELIIAIEVLPESGQKSVHQPASSGKKAPAGKPARNKRAEKPDSVGSASSPPSDARPWFASPTVISWGLAGLVACVGLAWAFSSRTHETPTTPNTPVADAGSAALESPNPDTPAFSNLAPKPGPKSEPQGETETETAPPVKPTAETRLAGLGAALKSTVEVAKSFPAGAVDAPDVPLDNRFGWLAQLAPTLPDQPRLRVDWTRSWRDPVNEPFVRRRMEPFLNPSTLALVGDDGFPATHFAGITGFGPDATSLPSDHVRAGVFGRRSGTSVEAIKDGLAHTAIVAGVETNLGSWASSGIATMRPYTSGPFVNGPDGFGVGDPKGMPVLMADGSVRFIAANVDPEIARRLVCLSDESEPLVPVDPTSDDPTPNPEDIAAMLDSADPDGPLRPIPVDDDGDNPPEKDDVAVEPLPPLNLDIAFAARLSRYDMQGNGSLVLVLQEFSDLLGCSVVLSEEARQKLGKRLDEPVRLSLANVSVRQALEAVLAPFELDHQIVDQRLLIVPREAVTIQPESREPM